ncbi:MAG: GTPase Era [Flavobacteriales bacterium]|nr:GTPase Era [Flavobacteriales bacterium]
MAHKAGFVNIVGSPNVGKSTLMNAMLGEKLSIITSKAQTTRHRILGFINEPEYQIIFSDTPGVVDPAYKLHEQMNSYVLTALRDADVLLVITDVFENEMNYKPIFKKIQKLEVPTIVLINKIDLSDQKRVGEKIALWREKFPKAEVYPISALHNFHLKELYDRILELLPDNPPFFPKDEMTNKPMRFFVSEIIREKIFLHYKKEIPYSCEVIVTEYKEEKDLVRIRAEIMVSRDSQKSILIGQGGTKLKHVGIDSRKEMETFIGKKVYLETYVKVDKDWRNKDSRLKHYGY